VLEECDGWDKKARLDVIGLVHTDRQYDFRLVFDQRDQVDHKCERCMHAMPKDKAGGETDRSEAWAGAW